MELINKGKRILIIAIAIIIAFDIISIALFSTVLHEAGKTNEATYILAQGCIRLTLTFLLCYFIFKGHRWARIIMMILGGFTAVAGITALFSGDMFSILAVVVGTIIFFVFLSEPVTVYQRYKKDGVIDIRVSDDRGKTWYDFALDMTEDWEDSGLMPGQLFIMNYEKFEVYTDENGDVRTRMRASKRRK